jgi:hypothetical protein
VIEPTRLLAVHACIHPSSVLCVSADSLIFFSACPSSGVVCCGAPPSAAAVESSARLRFDVLAASLIPTSEPTGEASDEERRHEQCEEGALRLNVDA